MTDEDYQVRMTGLVVLASLYVVALAIVCAVVDYLSGVELMIASIAAALGFLQISGLAVVLVIETIERRRKK